MKVEKSGKNGPITIILNGNGEANLFWHLFNISERNLGRIYFDLEKTLKESAKEAFEVLENNGVRFWNLLDKVCRPNDYPRR